MKRSIRLPFSLLVLLALLTTLSFRSAVRRRSSWTAGAPAAAPLNQTLFRLAAVDAGEPAMRKDVDELLDGNFPLASGRRRPISLWRRDNHPLLDERQRSSAAAHHPIRLRAMKDYSISPEFRRSLRDWFRRRRFQPSIMSELLALVKSPIDQNQNQPYGSCAVVGNSGILLNHNHGELIDAHDIVIRLNNARISGYERNVGSKTGISFVNSNILHLCARRPRCFCHPYGESVPMIMYICQAAHFLDYTACNSSHKAPLLVTDPRFDLLCARIVKYYSLKGFVEATGKRPEEWSKTHDERSFHYSSGMQALMLAVGICDKVSVFGFGKSLEAKHHYHTNQKAELDLHDYDAEYMFYHDLMERPEVIPYLKDSGFRVPPVVFYH